MLQEKAVNGQAALGVSQAERVMLEARRQRQEIDIADRTITSAIGG